MRIKITGKRPNQIRGFYLLMTNFPITGFEKNIYIMPDKAAKLLKKEKIHFEVLE